MRKGERESEGGKEREKDEGRERKSQFVTIIFTFAISFSTGKTGLLISL